MNYGAEPADQVVRYSLEGTEVALRLSGRAAVTFAKFVAAVLQDQKKTHGKTRLVRLLREGAEVLLGGERADAGVRPRSENARPAVCPHAGQDRSRPYRDCNPG